MTVNNQKDYFSTIICSSILYHSYKDNLPVLNKISIKITQISNTFFKTNRLSEISNFVSTSNLLNLILLKEKLNLTNLNDMLIRAK